MVVVFRSCSCLGCSSGCGGGSGCSSVCGSGVVVLVVGGLAGGVEVSNGGRGDRSGGGSGGSYCSGFSGCC